jgi:hypothetical protein
MEEFSASTTLARLGIEEVEANVCEDTFENRRALVDAKVPYKVFEPGLLEVDLNRDGDGLSARHSSMYEKYRIILVNPKDPWSDYLPFDELPLDYMETAPAWIQRHLNKYRDALEEGVREDKLPVLPRRCSRHRADGSRCWAWSWPAISANFQCKTHAPKFAFDAVGQAAQLRDAARLRIAQLTPHAIDVMEDLMLNSNVPHVRLKAATELLDRDGIRGGSELTVSGQIDHTAVDPAQVVRDRLESLGKRLAPKELEEAPAPETGDIVDAEVVEEPEPKTDD